MLFFCSSRDEATKLSVFNEDEWCEIVQAKRSYAGQATELLEKYHCSDNHKLYDEIIEVETLELFSVEELEKLQLMVLKRLHEKEIVIETLPTSNIRIGQHKNFSTYHLWNWIRWSKEGHSIPPIVIGSDDTGIFATNIYNEFANIYCHLTTESKMNHTDTMVLLEQFDKNGQIYRFDNNINADLQGE